MPGALGCTAEERAKCAVFALAMRAAAAHLPRGAGLPARRRVRVQDHGRKRKRP